MCGIFKIENSRKVHGMCVHELLPVVLQVVLTTLVPRSAGRLAYGQAAMPVRYVVV